MFVTLTNVRHNLIARLFFAFARKSDNSQTNVTNPNQVSGIRAIGNMMTGIISRNIREMEGSNEHLPTLNAEI